MKAVLKLNMMKRKGERTCFICVNAVGGTMREHARKEVMLKSNYDEK